jgi:hypothetical protein
MARVRVMKILILVVAVLIVFGVAQQNVSLQPDQFDALNENRACCQLH